MSEQDAAKGPFEDARALYNKHNYSDAVAAYREALGAFEVGGTRANETDVKLRRKEGYSGLADSFSSLWRYQDAFDNYIKSKGIDPEQPEVYTGLGEALDGLSRYQEAIENYQQAASIYQKQATKARDEYEKLSEEEIKTRRGEAQQRIDEAEDNYVDSCNNLGSTYLYLGQYDKAIEQFTVAVGVAKRRGKDSPYAHHNLASVYQIQGRYQEAMERWNQADWLYREEHKDAYDNGWIGHFLYFGNMLHEVFGDFDEAAKAYEEGLKLHKDPADGDHLNEDHIGILTSQVALYLEKMEDAPGDRNLNNLAARKAYGQAKGLLAKMLVNTRPPSELDPLLTMGELALTMNEYGEAEDFLKEAFLKDADAAPPYEKSARPATDLGVLCMRRKEFKEAIRYFEKAVKMDTYDLTILSNLAEALLKDGQLEEAEKQFQRALDIAPDHVESRIGLAGVYAALGEIGDTDMYSAAIAQYTEALRLAKGNTGSKRLKKKELAAVLYSRGYARVKFGEASKGVDRGLLHNARADFNECLMMDPEQHKAKRAVEKINKVLPRRSPQGLLEKWGPLVILAFSMFVFLLSQASFIWSLNGVQHLTVNEYIALTFGSLVLMVASCYLPQLLKLKIPGIELEKAVVDQITFVGTVGISKQ